MGQTLWAGDVQVFDLPPGSPSPRAYAWSYETTGNKRQFVAVLHASGIDSAEAAVRAFVVTEARKAKAEKQTLRAGGRGFDHPTTDPRTCPKTEGRYLLLRQSAR